MLGSVFQIEATARPGHTAEELEKAIDEELATFRESGPDAGRGGARAQRHRDAHRPGAREPRRLRRRRRSPEHLQPLPRRSGLPAEGHPALSRRDAGVGEGVRRSSSSRRARASSSTACPATPDLGAPVPTPKPAQAAPGTGAESVNRRRGRGARTRRRPAKREALQVPVADLVPAAERPDGARQRASGAADRVGEPRREDRQRREPGGQAGPGQLHGRDARRRHRDRASALQIADEVAQLGGSLTHGVDDGRVAGRRRARCSGPSRQLLDADGRRRRAVRAFPAEEIERQRASRLAQPGPAAREPERGRRRRRWRPRSTDRRIRTATPSSAPRRRTRR